MIIVILAGAAFVALDPATRFADSRDATRWTDVTAILEAAKVAQVDNEGAYTFSVTDDTDYMIGTSAVCTAVDGMSCGAAVITDGDCVDLTSLVTSGYLAEVPVDSQGGDAAYTGYYLNKAANGSLTVAACEPENATTISVSR